MMLHCYAIVGYNGDESFSAQGLVCQVKHVCVMLYRCTVVGGSSIKSFPMKGSEW